MSSTPTVTVAPRPDVHPPGPWAFPTPRTTTLEHGLTLSTVHLPGQHVLSIRVAVPAPVQTEPTALEGAAVLAARLFDEGSTRRDAEQMAVELERRGIAFGAGAGERGFMLEVETLARELPAALDLTLECLTEPAFGEREVGRAVRTRLADIQHERASAGVRASQGLAAAFWDPRSRASRPLAGTPESVRGITREALADFHGRHVHPDGTHVVVVGDLTGLDVEAQVARATRGWTTHSPDGTPRRPAPAVPVTRPAGHTRVVLVDRPGSVQTELQLACAGPDRRDPAGWATNQLLGYVLGGTTTSRLDAVLREEKGYTYGMRAGMRPRTSGGQVVVSGSVRSDATVDSVDLTRRVLADAAEGFGEAEVRGGADFLARTAPGRFATADAVADELVILRADGLDPQGLTEDVTRLLTVTPADVDAAYRTWVADAAWTLVLVGEVADLVDPLRDIGLDDVEVLRD